MSKFSVNGLNVEAVQLKWSTWNEMCDFLGDIINPESPGMMVYDEKFISDDCGEKDGPWISLSIPTSAGRELAVHGDWIVKGALGNLHPCKPDIFKQVYCPVEEESEVVDWKDIAYQLAEALRLTQEYAGNGLLPKQRGWSWYDALERYNEAVRKDRDERG